MDGWTDKGQTLFQWIFMDTRCEQGSVLFWGPRGKLVPPFSSKELTVRPGDRCTQAGITTKQQEGRSRKEGMGWIRGEGKYLPRASDGQKRIKAEKHTESRNLSRKICEK